MKVIDLGVMPYRAAWDKQLEVHDDVSAGGEDVLLLVQHPPVMTLGAAFHAENLLLGVDDYQARGIDVVTTDRGGDVTFHGPGQLVVYPVFDIGRHGRDLHRWMRGLEEVFISVCTDFGLQPRRFPPHTGVWVGDRKVAAIGVKVRKWVNLHGIALNCSNDLAEFDLIVPCGIQGYGVTSLSRETVQTVTPDMAKPLVVEGFRAVFPTGGTV